MNNPLACPKCQYERKPTDTASFSECPSCGVNFVAFEKASRPDEEARLTRLKNALRPIIANTLKPVAPAPTQQPAARPVLVKVYSGSESIAMARFQADASKMAEQGYSPTAQTWVPGSYSATNFIVALLLCFVLIGFLILLAMLIVKPAGSLSVTYSLTRTGSEPLHAIDEKVCPRCAESVKAAATVCRFCGHEFT